MLTNTNAKKLLSDYLFLSLTLDRIKVELRSIEFTNEIELKTPYNIWLENCEYIGRTQRRQIINLLSTHEYDVVLLKQNDVFSSYLFNFNGHNEQRDYFNPVLEQKINLAFLEIKETSITYKGCFHSPKALNTISNAAFC